MRLIGMRIARIGAALLAVAAGIALIGWHHSSGGGPAPATPVTLVPVDGVVETQGGPPLANPGPDLHPIRSAQVLVSGIAVSGRRVHRRMIADRRGRFSLSLLPGSYRFTAVLYQGAIPLSQEPHTSVRIRVGQTTRPLPVSIIEPVF
jgi:hypothetical protein